jgi:hypothetical protein
MTLKNSLATVKNLMTLSHKFILYLIQIYPIIGPILLKSSMLPLTFAALPNHGLHSTWTKKSTIFNLYHFQHLSNLWP